jgi:hypothetical protein
MQQRVDVIKDVPLRDRLVFVVRAELFKRPVGYVLTAVRAVFVLGVEGKALRSPLRE